MEKDDRPSTSRLVFAAAGPRAGVWRIEVRSLDYGAGTTRLGELVLEGNLDGTLRARIDGRTYGDDLEDDDDYPNWV